MQLLNIFRQVLSGKSLWRVLIEKEIRETTIHGNVIDLGSGGQKSYARMMIQEDHTDLKTIDQKGTTSFPPINLDKDKLPVSDNSVDFALMINILEHLYNPIFAVSEAKRALKEGGTLIGFVPFYCHYHPGPKDYFRYTKDALEQILKDAGFNNTEQTVKEIGFGPFSSAFHILFLGFPRKRRKIFLPILAVFAVISVIIDKLFIKFNVNGQKESPLGYSFIVKK